MKDKDVLVIALAGFLHDIGKFAQRADTQMWKTKYDDTKNYQPQYNGNLTHIHVKYSACFIRYLEEKLPEIFNGLKIEGTPFIDLVASHHKPTNALEWIIACADRISSGMDKKTYDDNQAGINYKEYKYTRLASIFEEIGGIAPKNYEQYKYIYKLNPINSENIFPIEKDNEAGDYKELFENFSGRVLKLAHKENKELWFEHFDSLFQTYASYIPSATVGLNSPDISLYDHARTTAALASAIYVYHKENETLNENQVENYDDKKFIYLKSKFYGIQNFMFSQGGQTNKNSAKILRGRSFYISLLMELAADLLCKNLGLPHTSIIMNAAGAITAILPNTKIAQQKIKESEKLINNWLIREFYGEASVGFAQTQASGNDLLDLDGLGKTIAKQLEIKKHQKIDISCLGALKECFQDNQEPCAFCGKRLISAKENKEEQICPICQDLRKIGDNLTKQTKMIVVDKSDKQSLKKIIYDKYGLIFESDDNFYNADEKPASSLIKYWDLSDDFQNSTTTLKQFAAYIPKNEKGGVKDFQAIADSNDKEKGINALAALKCDIDNLGSLFLSEINKNGNSLSKQATFSRQVNSFWTIYLPSLLKNDGKFNDVYTVFAGGDDLFLIGKWDVIIDLAIKLKDAFAKYSCYNEKITISTGIALLKPGEPIKKFYRLSEDALEHSKDNEGKNSLTLFDETIKWAEYIREEKDKIAELLKDDKINSAGLQKLLSLIDMANRADEISIGARIADIKEMQNFKWRALLTYFIAMNENVKGQTDKQNLINDFVKQIEDLNKRKALKISLWKNIYKNRTMRR
ncbi:MAG: type III-A CRISPR-associated protein Cas10/Csm1 [Endomicrobium sp.]|jgi:CRISPR-associated protein Csm1|nr:type III-A CRISPR-associated protein Cas10/Csm1 [Endomicrobium sp.]